MRSDVSWEPEVLVFHLAEVGTVLEDVITVHFGQNGRSARSISSGGSQDLSTSVTATPNGVLGQYFAESYADWN